MKIFTVSLFGHRQINDWRLLDCLLFPKIKELIQNKTYVSFLIGRNGDFDEYAASVIKSVQKETGYENSEMNLVLPYKLSGIEYYEKYYDGIIIPDIACRWHPKSAITLRNKWMVEQSDLILFFVEHNVGGAYQALKYAERLGKDIINLRAVNFDKVKSDGKTWFSR